MDNQPVIEIRDSKINAAEIRQQVQQLAAQRGYNRDVTAVGPQPADTVSEALAFDPALTWQLLAQLQQRRQLKETEFTSNTPLVGSLIVTLRRLWNSVSTRWYVLPVLQQQTTFNSQLLALLHELLLRQELAEQKIAALESQLAAQDSTQQE